METQNGTQKLINIILFAGLFILTLIAIFNKPDCERKCHEGIKRLADEFGEANLDSKTAREFYNYLQE